MKFKFEKSVVIKAGLRELFNFHLNTQNITIISSPFPVIEKIEMSSNPLKTDSTVSLLLNFLIFRQNWIMKISEVKPFEVVTDIQVKGLFKVWEHKHIFEETNAGVKMTDNIIFSPPWGVIGLLTLPLLYLQLYLMFSDRHRRTRNFFER
jgi:ligand-binding SRPBCC domain-containing protein